MTALAPSRRSPGFDVIMGNPPFLNQVENATTVDKGLATIARLTTGDSAVRYTDVSAMFLLLSNYLLSDHGRSCLVQPQSLLAAKAAGPVRRAVLSDSALVGLWVSNEHVFENASVFTCAPTLERSGPRSGPIYRHHSSRFEALPEMELDVDELADEISWAHLVAEASGIPQVEIFAGGTIAAFADTVADFTEYYRLEGFIIDDDEVPPGADLGEYPPLVTTGLIDLAECRWGFQPTRILKQKWKAPRVDRQRMYAEGSLGPWIDRRRVPKVILATQTKVIEVFVDEIGEYIASIPLITVMPRNVEQVWHIAAALASPVTCAIALRHYAGAALSAEAIKISAKQTLALPIPESSSAWDEAASLLREAQEAGDGAERTSRLIRFASASVDAFRVSTDRKDPLIRWYQERLVGTSSNGGEDADE